VARVLVVDDDPDIVTLVQLQLRQSGYETVGASSGPQALARIEADGLPDVAVLDIRMPGMDGYELLAEIRARGFVELPVIFLSARAQQDDVDRGKAVGAYYLTKPYVSSDLVTAVDRAVAGEQRD
jgi:CheY-like chemotaxis protein